ncbi:pyruvate dehydrogenase [Actinoalloteichus spitiensis]|uniref:pyruvate dehydrogenase n=1 Tax=Actinoalloteichus spitiensis TaxID=252394 RepID=UPI00035F5773|nr:pyruvate dehydrogenase [Actinoalloteichus spitiensis]
MARNTVADQLVEILREVGVERVYGVVGDSLNPVVDGIRRRRGIEWTQVRHEESGAFAASAEAQVTGQLAVCAGSCGPGNLHLINGLYDAHRSMAPVLAIASHIPTSEIGTGYFQETHPDRLFVECSHYCEMVTDPEQLARVTRIAIQHAVGRGGVSVIILPGDVAGLAASKQPVGHALVTERPKVRPGPDELARLAELMNDANRVTLFCGRGTQGAHDLVMRLAERLKAPVGHALRGKEWIQYDNPFDVGMSGLLGYGACYEAMHEAELLVLLGTDFPYPAFLPDGVRIVQVDHRAEQLGRRAPLALGVWGSVSETIEQVLPMVREKRDRTFLDNALRKHAAALERVVGAYTQDVEHHLPIHPEYAASVLDEEAADDAVFTVDTGMCNVWAARYISPNGRRRLLGSFSHGSMANAVPQAIGAALAQPGRQVVAMAGDGGFAMLLGELLTLVASDLPVKVVLFNNSSLGMVKLEMLVAGLPEHGTATQHTDFAAIARAAGAHGVRVERPADLRAALREAFDRPGPAVVDVVTDPNALSMPPKITAEQVSGFALSMGRTVLAGGVGRMIQLARSNLRNIPRP